MQSRLPVVLACLLAAISLQHHAARSADPDAAGVEFFEKKIRPLLSERCYECHGPAKQRGGLRLDSLAAIRKGGDRGPPLVPGDPDKSLIIRAVGYADQDLRMPPKGKLPDQAVADLKTWIKMGAPGPKDTGSTAVANTFDMAERLKHWAYQPVRADPLPDVKQRDWPLTPIDNFILAKLEAAGLAPAPSADKRTLLRRVTFDLIGLPPTPAEIDAFLTDDSPDAFRKVVDRLLASPHYGERWGRHWLDLMRYAETLGHEFDFDIHNAWRYRDYVVRAFNDDLPYDQFVIEHLAGDLLPQPRRTPTFPPLATDSSPPYEGGVGGVNESIVATGAFWLGEGKQAPVDVRQEQADRIDNQIDVLGKAFLGQTIACARCHDHKFDAIPTKDYYALAGYLKSSRYQQAFLDPPLRFGPTARQLQGLQHEIKKALAPSWREQATRLSSDLASLDAARLDRWAKVMVSRPDAMMPPTVSRVFTRPNNWFITGPAFDTSNTAELIIDARSATRPMRAAGRSCLHSGRLSARLEGEMRSPTFTIEQPFVHFFTAGRGGRINIVIDGFTIIRDPIYGGLTLEINQDAPHWRTVDLRMWLGQRAHVELIDSTTPLPSAALGAEAQAGRAGSAYLAVDSIWISPDKDPPRRRTVERPEALDHLRTQLTALIKLCEDWSRSPNSTPLTDELGDLVNWLLDEKLLDVKAAEPLLAKYRELEAAIPAPVRAPALADGTGEDERVFLRGNHKTPGEIAPRSLLTAVAGSNQPAPHAGSGRLELARRLANAENPLFARVMVNRLWQHHFGEGLVRTPDDFGRMGEPPTHPELLDYLAGEFVRRGWSIKEMHRIMLLSRVYQLGSRPDDKPAQVDPQNRLWHHVPVRRLQAEAIRDSLLALSGRLDNTMFGPGVPPHLTPFMEGRGRPGASGPLDGAGRRSVYLAVRRNFLNPMFLAFDYPIPFSTIGRRSVSNVPAQALALMNDPFVLQQARLWAEHALKDAKSPDERIANLYVTAYARSPTGKELETATAFLASQAARLGCGLEDVRVWTDLCHVLINVKEFVFVE
jgi:hypothetical protein